MLRIDGPDLGRIIELAPRVLPGTAAVLAPHLADEDEMVRGWVEIGAARQQLPGIACPAC